jgi:hypothetical protein
MITYHFRENSIKGLLVDVTVIAKNYKEAKRKVLKHIYLHTEGVLCVHVKGHACDGTYCNGITSGVVL